MKGKKTSSLEEINITENEIVNDVGFLSYPYFPLSFFLSFLLYFFIFFPSIKIEHNVLFHVQLYKKPNLKENKESMYVYKLNIPHNPIFWMEISVQLHVNNDFN